MWSLVEMRKRDHIVVVAFDCLKVLAQLIRQVDAEIALMVRAPHMVVIKRQFFAAAQIAVVM